MAFPTFPHQKSGFCPADFPFNSPTVFPPVFPTVFHIQEEEEKRKAEKAARDTIKERVKKCRQRLRGFHQASYDAFVMQEIHLKNSG